MKNAIVLCSGGMDSVVTAYFAKKRRGYKKMILLFFNYGQKSLEMERRAVKRCSRELHAEFREIKIKELNEISTSLINKNGKIRRLERSDLKSTKDESKRWYVPCRNLIFLSYALAFAEFLLMKRKESYDIFVGFKNEGKDFFPDQTKIFLKNINAISQKNCAASFKIHAPLIKKDKENIVALGTAFGVKLENTWSCYIGGKIQCGKCLACMLRKEGFYWANMEDKTAYLE